MITTTIHTDENNMKSYLISIVYCMLITTKFWLKLGGGNRGGSMYEERRK